MTDYLTRAAAVDYCRERGVVSVTMEMLKRHAMKGTGPAYSKFGRYPYYTLSDLDAWIQSEMRPVTEGRGSLRTAA